MKSCGHPARPATTTGFGHHSQTAVRTRGPFVRAASARARAASHARSISAVTRSARARASSSSSASATTHTARRTSDQRPLGTTTYGMPRRENASTFASMPGTLSDARTRSGRSSATRSTSARRSVPTSASPAGRPRRGSRSDQRSTPTSRSPAPRARTISALLGQSETIRRGGRPPVPVTATRPPGRAGRPAGAPPPAAPAGRSRHAAQAPPATPRAPPRGSLERARGRSSGRAPA